MCEMSELSVKDMTSRNYTLNLRKIVIQTTAKEEMEKESFQS